MSQASLKQPIMDMNDPATLNFYRNLIVFQHDLSRPEILFSNPSNVEQRTIQALAHSLNLVFEYTLQSQSARVVRQPPKTATPWIGFNTNHELPPVDYDSSGVELSATIDGMWDISKFRCDSPLWDSTADSTDLTFPSSTFPSAASLNDLERHVSAAVQPEPYSLGESQTSNSQSLRTSFGNATADVNAQMSDYNFRDSTIGTASAPPYRGVSGPRSPGSSQADMTLDLVHELMSAQLISNVNAAETREFPGPSTSSGICGDDPDSRLQQTRLGPGSMSSDRSNHSHRSYSGVKRHFHRRSSVKSQASSGYNEIIFDSSSACSRNSLSSAVSQASVSSGRRTPLSEVARVGMNIMRKVGACWRCKILRKTCDPNSPCAMCPRKISLVGWVAVGCQRGNIKCRTFLCPAAKEPEKLESMSSELWRYQGLDHLSRESLGINVFHREWALRRSQDLAVLEQPGYDPMNDHRLKDAGICGILQDILAHSSSSDLPPSSKPLSQCLMDIVWEILLYCPTSPHSLSDLEGLRGMLSILFAAVKYEAKTQARKQTDQLIAQSLICFRSCLEAVRAKTVNVLEPQSHKHCMSDACIVDCIDSVKSSLSLYHDELSRVMFDKANMRNRKPWWLSTFYSFNIQSFVREALATLEEDLVPIRQTSSSYLRLPVRLFIASTGSHDPMLKSDIPFACTTTDDGDSIDPLTNEYKQARLAVGQENWALNGIHSTADYLRMLFDDNGEVMDLGGNEANESSAADGFDFESFVNF